MDRTKSIAGITVLLALAGCSGSPSSRPVVVGSKNFTEQVVLGEVVAQHLERRLGRKVERRLNLGGTLLAHQALLSGGIDLYPEYTGTALAAILKQSTGNDPAAVLAQVRSAYTRLGADWLDPLGIDNSFAMVVTGSQARAQHLETLTDAARREEPWALGVGYEFQTRADGMAALDRTYRLRWKAAPKSMDLGLLYQALEQGQVDMIAANATDGLLSKLDLVMLKDDRHAFPPYQVCLVVRQDRLREVTGLRQALEELSGKFTNSTMQHLNYEVDALHQPVAQVAAEFLKQLE